MSKGWRITLAIAALIVLFGIAVCTIGLFMGGGFLNTEKFEKFTETFTADVSEIRTDLNIVDLRVYRSDGDEIVVTYYDNENEHYTMGLSEGVLSIARDSNKKWYQYIGFNFYTHGYEAEIGIPEGFDGVLTLKASTGNLDISGVGFDSGVSITLSTGDVTLPDVRCAGDMSLLLTTGDITVTTLEASGDFTVKSSTGDQEYSGLCCEGDILLTATTGNFRISGANAVSLCVNGGTGDAVVDGITVAESIYIELSTGSVKGGVTDGIENYSIQSHTSTGSNNLPGQSVYGPKQLEVYTSTGDINFGFNK